MGGIHVDRWAAKVMYHSMAILRAILLDPPILRQHCGYAQDTVDSNIAGVVDCRMPEHNRIKELLAERKENQDAFALRVGIAPRTLTNVIKGRPTHRSTRRLIAQGFSLDEKDVFSAASDYYYSNTDALASA